MECVVSDMTTFYVEGTYYELTLYMDLWNDELIAHALSAKRGDRMTYLNGLQDVIDFKKQYGIHQWMGESRVVYGFAHHICRGCPRADRRVYPILQ